MIRLAQKLTGRADVSYWGFDLFEDMTLELNERERGKPRLAPAMKTVEDRLRATGALVKLVKGNTRVTLSECVPGMEFMDLILIDGGHSLETIDNDWRWASELMGPHTVCLFDDYYPDREDVGAKRLIDSLMAGGSSWFCVELLLPVDHYKHTGVTVQMAKVTRKP